MRIQISYIDLIKGIENEKTKELIGKIDCDSLLETNGDNLLYMFPLIERMVLEIYKLNPESNIEDFKQGIMKTTNSIFESNIELELLPDNLIGLIKSYFEEDGTRNKIFHVNYDSSNLLINYRELQYIIMHLLSILRDNCNGISQDKLKIELL